MERNGDGKIVEPTSPHSKVFEAFEVKRGKPVRYHYAARASFKNA